MNQDSRDPPVELLTIAVETPDGRLPTARVSVPDVPTRLTEIVPPMQMLCDGIVALAIRRERQHGATVSCRKGCGACCAQLAPVSPPEAFFLSGYVRRLPLPRRSDIEARFAAVRDAMETAGLVERLRHLKDTQEHQDLARDYFRLGVPCPFLEEEACTIHENRPFACREYNVTSPVELCADPFRNKVRRVSIPKRMTTVMALLAAELYEAPPTLIPLTLALGWAQENRSHLHRTWPGVWLFHRAMEHVAQARPET